MRYSGQLVTIVTRSKYKMFWFSGNPYVVIDLLWSYGSAAKTIQSQRLQLRLLDKGQNM